MFGTLFEAKIKAHEHGGNSNKGNVNLCFYAGLYFICSNVHARVNFYKVIKKYNRTY